MSGCLFISFGIVIIYVYFIDRCLGDEARKVYIGHWLNTLQNGGHTLTLVRQIIVNAADISFHTGPGIFWASGNDSRSQIH